MTTTSLHGADDRGAGTVPPGPWDALALRRPAPLVPDGAWVTTTWPAPSRVAVHVAGEIDMSTVLALADSLLTAIEAPPCRTLLVDLGEVDFLGAAGVGVLAWARARAATRAVAVHLVAASRAARRTLELTGALDPTTGACFDTWPTLAQDPAGRCPAPRSADPSRPVAPS